MAALVQSYPQQSGSVTMLQARPSSASGMLQGSQNPPNQYSPTPNQSHRNSFHGMNSAVQASNYRGSTVFTPIAPYAFTSTPSLMIPPQRGSVPQEPKEDVMRPVNRSRYNTAPSVSTTSSSSSSDLSSASYKSGSRDDSGIMHGSQQAPHTSRPQSVVITSAAQNTPLPAVTSPVKAVPDRYRRAGNRRTDSSQSNPGGAQPALSAALPNTAQFYGNAEQGQRLGTQMPQLTRRVTADDMELYRHAAEEQSKKSRRRSIHTVGEIKFTGLGGESYVAGSFQQGLQYSAPSGRDQQHAVRTSPLPNNRHVPHGRNGSTESVNSSRSSHQSTTNSAPKREAGMPVPTSNPTSPSSAINKAIAAAEKTSYKNESSKALNIPPRASSSDVSRRLNNPSPLSKPMTMSPETPVSKDSFASAVNAALHTPERPAGGSGTKTESLAVQQLAALNEKESKKSKTSRLRRAFSFGSAAELRRVSAENAANRETAPEERAKLRKEQYQDEEEAEQARIAQQQEAAGLGSAIYSGQGNIFSGSTDNLSISSTASSASIMIRKMGKGMKKSTRSLVGLFRPKSVIGVPAADGPVTEASRPEVSRVTVEAESSKVNISAHPRDQPAGATGFPKLERNSMDAARPSDAPPERLGSSGTENSSSRRSIVGGDRERAEILAAVKKGILKRTDSGNSSPVTQPLDDKAPSLTLPHIPTVSDSPSSSAPSTPKDESQGHKSSGSVTIGGEDYFMSALRFRGDSKSSPATTPHGTIKRNATFSPRIQFHDTWPSGEYDRRGEIATCNRLTPMLAQQIKEELNTFKMEMEVHESSKIYTHFF